MSTPQNAALKVVGNIVELPLTSLIVDFTWNCRGEDPALAQAAVATDPANPGDKDGEVETDLNDPQNDFRDLVSAIESQGQNDPVIVCPNKPDGKPCPEGKFWLTAGFRRVRALQVIAEKNGKKYADVMVKCVIKDLKPVQMVTENLTENVARRNLKVHQLVTSIARLKKQHEAAGIVATGETLGSTLGLNRMYANKLLKLNDDLAPEVLEKWRKSPVEVGANRIEKVAKKAKEEQMAAFDEAALSGGRGNRTDVKNPKAWLQTATNEAIRVGTFLGHLEFLGRIDTSKLDFDKHLEECIRMPAADSDKAPSKKERNDLVKAIDTAYKTALAGPPKEEPKKEEKKDEKKAEKPKGNGARASA